MNPKRYNQHLGDKSEEQEAEIQRLKGKTKKMSSDKLLGRMDVGEHVADMNRWEMRTKFESEIWGKETVWQTQVQMGDGAKIILDNSMDSTDSR